MRRLLVPTLFLVATACGAGTQAAQAPSAELAIPAPAAHASAGPAIVPSEPAPPPTVVVRPAAPQDAESTDEDPQTPECREIVRLIRECAERTHDTHVEDTLRSLRVALRNLETNPSVGATAASMCQGILDMTVRPLLPQCGP